jgi:hypothetical protein
MEDVMLQSLTVHNLYLGEGSDSSGVPTKMLTVNGSLKMNIYNPAPLFGIHVSSTPVNLIYSEITVATGQVRILYSIFFTRIEVDHENLKQRGIDKSFLNH